MARLHEHQGKAILAKHGIGTPRGATASSPEEARGAAMKIGCPCVLKIQAWTTGRAAIGGIAFADTPEQAADHARRMLEIRVGQFPVTQLLIEEKVAVAQELFVSLSVDDARRAPVILLSLTGGSGIEERAGAVQRFDCDPVRGPDRAALRQVIGASAVPAAARAGVEEAIAAVFAAARDVEARSVEINPLVVTTDSRVIAADCRVTIDDYAVFRHPELGIDIARELDHPPTDLERIAYQVEQEDHRGTFYFAQMNAEAGVGSAAGSQSRGGLIGFHGAGGGGSMMSMDAITAEGFTLANFCDTSGNPSAAKVYRAARVILSQPGLVGYFGSGSGVANQEQFWSAYGLAKAFWELELSIPAVIRLGGNTEDRAVEILRTACKSLPAKVEGYKKTDSPAKIAARFAALVEEHRGPASSGDAKDDTGLSAKTSTNPRHGGWSPREPRRPSFVGQPASFSFAVKAGRVWIDAAAWKAHGPAIVARANGLLRDEGGRPAITVAADAFLMKDSDMIACEVECRAAGIGGADGAVFVELEMPSLAALKNGVGHSS